MENRYDSFDLFADGPEGRRRFPYVDLNSSAYVDPSTIDDVFEFYRVSENFEKALSLMQFAIDRFPYRPDYYFHKSILEYERGNLGHAMHDVVHALELRPFDSDLMLHRARIQFADGKERLAKITLNSIFDTCEETAELYGEMGTVCQQAKQYELAIEYFKKALALDPDAEDALYEAVLCYEQLNQVQEGMLLCQQHLDNNPFSTMGWYNLGMLYYKVGLYENAIQAIDYSLCVDENFLSAYYTKGLALMAIGRLSQATQVFLEALQLDAEDAATLQALAECYAEMGSTRRARFYFRRLTHIFPEWADGWLGMATSLEDEGRPYDAIRFYKRATELEDDCYDAWLGLAECEYQMQNYVSAFEALGQAVALDPQDVEMWQEWATRLAADERLDVALELLEHGLRHNPGAFALAYQYSAYAFTAGRSKEAFVYLENALLMDFEKHKLLYEYSPRIAKMRPIQELIAQYQPR